ncbi:MAG TPA: PEGA domain-containing protein [Myxococcota bacterium]|jgi:hypothetical protein|nr:PEGA domain-containing protein [Myxococcota bacterium]
MAGTLRGCRAVWAPVCAVLLLGAFTGAAPAQAAHKKHTGGKKGAPPVATTTAAPDTAPAAPPPAAEPRPEGPPPLRLAALLLRAEGGGVDATVSDSLTEVLITTLASTGRFDLVGKEEVKALLKVDDEMRALECIASAACLGALATHLHVAKALVGTVGRDKGAYLVNLTLVNLLTGETEQNLFLKVEGDIAALSDKLSAVAVGAATPRPSPGTVAVSADVGGAEVLVDDASVGKAPARKAGLTAGVHKVKVVKPGYFDWTADVPVAAGAEVAVAASLKVDPSYEPYKSRPSFRVAAAVAAGFAVAGGGAAGTLSYLAVRREHRAEGSTEMATAFGDAGSARDFALGANIAFGVAGAALVTAVILAIVFKDDVFGLSKEAKDTKAPAAHVGLAPLSGGGAAAVEVAW